MKLERYYAGTMEEKVSIILPVYNGEATVGKAIESVLNQTYPNLELIIVNDCSTDRTSEIINEYTKDDRVFIIENSMNMKLPASLNIGFSHASGVYYTWTSDDNCYMPDAIDCMRQVLVEKSDVDFVYADYVAKDLSGKSAPIVRKLEEPKQLIYGNVIGACFLYTKKLALEVGQYNPDMFLVEDYDYWIRCYQHGRLYHIDRVLYEYGIHDKNLTSTRRPEICRQIYHVKEEHFDFLYSNCYNDNEKIRFLESMVVRLEGDELKIARSKLYGICKCFRKHDRKKRVNNEIRRVEQKILCMGSKIKHSLKKCTF